jgi:hypothetical protein
MYTFIITYVAVTGAIGHAVWINPTRAESGQKAFQRSVHTSAFQTNNKEHIGHGAQAPG